MHKRRAAQEEEQKRLKQQQEAAEEIWEQAATNRAARREEKRAARERGEEWIDPRDRESRRNSAGDDAPAGSDEEAAGGWCSRSPQRSRSPVARRSPLRLSGATSSRDIPMGSEENGVRALKKEAAVQQEKRKANLKGVFAFGADDDDDRQTGEFEEVRRKRTGGTSTPLPSSHAPRGGGSMAAEARKLDPAELGRRLAEFKKEQVKNGRRVFTSMPEDLRIALAACVAAGKAV